MSPLVTAPTAAGLPRTPYLTVAEFKAAPTDLDLSVLVQGGTAQQQDDALATVILQASSAMDGYVHYTLGATLDTEVKRVRVRRDGYVVVATRAVPVQEIDTFAIGLIPSQMTQITASGAADAWIDENTIWMPANQPPTSPARTMSAYGVGSRVFCQWSYVNGYPNTLLTAQAAAGATSIQVQSSLAIYAGTNLTIYDSGLSETVAVATSYVGGVGSSTTIPLTSGLLFAHNAKVSVSALPPNVKKAAVLWTGALIKTRGSAALEMASLENPGPVMGGEGGAVEDIAMAEGLLQRYVLPLY